MNFKIIEETVDILPEYENVSIAYLVETIFHTELFENGLGGIKLIEKKLKTPFIKDYDAIEDDKPSKWHKKFNIENWEILSAFDGEERIGGAAIAWKMPEIESCEDTLWLWDVRVSPDYRGKKIGQQLFAAVLCWAQKRNCRKLKVETQNVSVPACKFYARQGCKLGAINKFAYPERMNEIQLIWHLNL